MRVLEVSTNHQHERLLSIWDEAIRAVHEPGIWDKAIRLYLPDLITEGSKKIADAM
jgi:hypothetical protein